MALTVLWLAEWLWLTGKWWLGELIYFIHTQSNRTFRQIPVKRTQRDKSPFQEDMRRVRIDEGK